MGLRIIGLMVGMNQVKMGTTHAVNTLLNSAKFKEDNMKSSDIPDYARVFRRLTLDGWNYYVDTLYGDVPISKSTYEDVKIRNARYKNKLRNRHRVLRNS